MRYFGTGCAGFIGSNLTDSLLEKRFAVSGYDNFSTGFPNNLVSSFNLGVDEYYRVNESIGWICEHLGVKPELDYTGGGSGVGLGTARSFSLTVPASGH